MSSGARAQALAIAGALAAFLLLMLALRLRSWLPFLGAALTYLALLWACRPSARPAPNPAKPASGPAPGSAPESAPGDLPLPHGVTRDDHRAALDTLARAGRELDALAAGAPPADAPMIRRMAALVDAIRLHHAANPAHVPRTRPFVRHALPRMVAAVAGYLDLCRRTGAAGDGPDREARLAEVARRLEAFVPVLERIERACLEDDLMALEINVEVLDEQLGRRTPDV